jgi:hypothetical protein
VVGSQPYTPAAITLRNYSWYSFMLEAESTPQGHYAARRNRSMKISIGVIGKRTRDLRTCSAVPQPTALPRALPLEIRPRPFLQKFLINNFLPIVIIKEPLL